MNYICGGQKTYYEITPSIADIVVEVEDNKDSKDYKNILEHVSPCQLEFAKDVQKQTYDFQCKMSGKHSKKHK